MVNANDSEDSTANVLGSGLRVEYLATLTKHMKSVNCVRFSPSGEFLASAGDGKLLFYALSVIILSRVGGVVILWKQSETSPLQFNKAFGDDSEEEDDTDRKEFWRVAHQFRAMDGEDVYDLAWSPDGKYLIMGLTDNTAQIWDTLQAKCVKVLKDHQHFVQGVAWDPMDQFILTQSSDRSAKVCTMRSNGKGGVNFYSLAKYSKLEASTSTSNSTDAATISYSIFHDETLVSFFRRPSFSPDGSLLCFPAGQRTPLTSKNSPHGIYLNLRNNLHKTPAAFIGGFEKAAIAIRFNPRLLSLISLGPEPYVALPYRMIFGVVTQNSVYIFDTQNKAPLFMFANLHYASLTDVAWSADGSKLVASSVDGFCTVAEFDAKNDFGTEFLPLEESERILNEISGLVKAIPFFIPPVPKKSINSAAIFNQESLIQLSSDIDVVIECEDPDEDVTMLDNENSKDIRNTEEPVVIHNPPVKRRIAPTLLSKEI